MKYFTSDWHLGDDRIGVGGKTNLFYRPFSSVIAQNSTIINNFIQSDFKDGDELWHLGDVLYDTNYEKSLEHLRSIYPHSKFNLIVGNYDEDKLDVLGKYFDNIYSNKIVLINSSYVYLNHYPIECSKQDFGYEIVSGACLDFAITGHIHGLWKVQRNMINVGVDAWHFRPVSETEILFCWNAMQKFYDENVFPY